ncbi:Pectinesterase QRT1 [Acorus gramineus]|uniref:Pectinesterase n=1 Tax=Acorus gramineus TaxID=55184 RepID=A0AAV9BCT0_ACOGR|nr:Pectinesterase QRT1 [Acorus gramineus]
MNGLSIASLLLILTTHTTICRCEDGFITWGDLHLGRTTSFDGGGGERVIVVDKRGKGDSSTVRGALDMVPDGNPARVKIFLFPGIYREKVVVPITKPYVTFIGNDSANTVISWNARASDRSSDGGYVGTLDSATFAVEAEYFCAKGITFENTSPNAKPGEKGMQAVALRVSADKAMFLDCRILGSQDTLFDHNGRHYYLDCFIQGSIDFIFGDAKSLYQECTLHSVATSYGAIAASQRNSMAQDSGFSFFHCQLDGHGSLYLGRAWGRYATVVYSFCELDGIVIPQGWDDWGDPSRTRTAWFGEFECTGRGAYSSERVPWAKSLTYDEARPFLDLNYIDGDQWLRL